MLRFSDLWVLEDGGVVLELSEVGDDAAFGQRQLRLRTTVRHTFDQRTVAALEGRKHST